MIDQLTEEQNKLIQNIAHNNGFSDFEVITKPGSVKGDNFLGILTVITIKCGERNLELILKTAHQNEALRKAAPLEEVYKREIYLYEVIFNEFKKYQEENKIEDQFISYPRLYGSNSDEGHECLVMENLKEAGYQLWNKKDTMNHEHLTAVLKEYAKFHSISLAMRHKHPKLFDQLTERMLLNVFEKSDLVTNPEKLEAYIKSVFGTVFQAVEDDAELTEYVQKLQDQLPEIFANNIRDPRYKIVINHGDSWCNNFLFKYQDPNNNLEPSSLRIIDWQLSYLSSPASDFCYFFLAHCSKEMFANYESYLQVYYKSLSKQLQKFGCDPEEIFPIDEFKDHLKIFMKSSLAMVMSILKIMVCESDEAPDFAQAAAETGDLSTSMGFKTVNFEDYKKRVINVIEFLRDNDFID